MNHKNITVNSVFFFGGLIALAISIFVLRANPVGLAISGIMLTQSFSLFADPEESVSQNTEVVFENLNSGILVVDTKDVIEKANRAAELILRRSKRSLIGQPINEVFPKKNGVFFETKENVYEIKSTPLIDEHNHLRGKVIMLYDITEYKLKEERLTHLATHDNLTNLPNRVLFFEQLSHAVEQCKRTGSQLAVLFIDIDDFKSINDTYGHEHGDQVLREFAKRLNYATRNEDIVARLAGDEFAIILENISSPLAIAMVIEKIFLALSIPFVLGNHRIPVTTSIGVSICPKDGDEPKNLMMKADTAMYHVKKGGKNTFQFYFDLPKD